MSPQGIVRALREYQHKLLENNVSIFVRRGGPNYQEGLRAMREVGSKLGLKMYVFGPETHMTAIVGMALGTRPIPKSGLIEKSGSTASVMGLKSVSIYNDYTVYNDYMYSRLLIQQMGFRAL